MKKIFHLFAACSVLLTSCDHKPQVQQESKHKEKELEKPAKPHTDAEKKG